MKNLTTAAIILIPLTYIGWFFIWNFSSEKYYVQLLSEALTEPRRWSDLFKWTMIELSTAFMIIVPIVYLLSSDQAMKNKLYSLIRLVFIMELLFSLPSVILIMFRGGFGPELFNYITLGARFLIFIFIGVVLWMDKPANAIPRINLSDYELVSYTGGNQRLLHYFVDSCFFTCLSFDWLLAAGVYEYYDQNVLLSYLVSLINFVIYYFVAEALFCQTLGKALTGSCVVGVGGRLSTGQILGRSFARLIPFDPLSFLWNGKWHDKASSTTVVHAFSWEDIVFEGEDTKEQA
ncbi:MAG: RDD family protein [Pseudobacter sp.]|uniref:RDD family protein n=1 Tax=Pseudobacter sp. TaxID=2045420 RepID=UPI003F7EB65E